MNKIIQFLVIALNGAFIGAMILIALVLVPFWKASDPQSFLDWFSTYSGKLGTIMIPLGPGVLVLAIVSLLLNWGHKLLWGCVVLFTLVNILYFPFYYLPTNNSFAAQEILITEVPSELDIWLRFHWQRTFFALAALFASIFAAAKSMIGAAR